ncbi:MAG: hypothetical protein CM1200mP31_6320 [Candidatus Neomarinimicrobiota bacterium]|nr:MAG: hypothetical protein CM1200mP31_6320 [Candidatus Neomarinimicrobiota bacterium]
MEIILASKSPRRRKIFSELGYHFNIYPSEIDEENKNKLLPDDYVRDISEKKAFSVWEDNRHNAIVAGDTIINLKEKIIGKPKSTERHLNYQGIVKPNTLCNECSKFGGEW